MENPKGLTGNSNNIQDVYKNIGEYNPGRKCNILIVFDDIIIDMIRNKKGYQIVTEQIIRGIKLNISTVFITHSYFPVPKVPISSKKIPKKGEIQQIAINHSSDINSKDMINIYKGCMLKLFSF